MKILRAVVLTIANRFELASTRSPAESCLSVNDSTLIFTLVLGQKCVGLPLNLLRRKLSYCVSLKVFSEHSIVPMERYSLCLELIVLL